ncbi:MAG: hypothetical protein O7J95_06045 [Planctomycetota bacterium]|nr:hypothetical protein [Planctomycetota bacterium]
MERVGDKPATDRDLVEEICALLLQCQKQTSLYPRSHPRVQESLAGIKSRLEEYYRQNNRPFLLMVSETLDEIDDPDHPERQGSDKILAQLLEYRLIEKIVLLPDVSKDELHEFCYLIRDDVLKQPEKRDQVLVNLSELQGVHLSFYTPQDLPAVLLDGDSASDAAKPSSAAKSLSSLEGLLASLPESIGRTMREALTSPQVAERVSSLRRLVAQNIPGDNKSPAQSVPLLQEIVRTVAQSAGSSDEGKCSPETMRDGLCQMIEFFENNANSLLKKLAVLPGEGGVPLLDGFTTLTEKASGLSDEVKKVLDQKDKVSAMFQAAGSRVPPPSRDPPEATKAGDSRRHDNNAESTASLEESFRDIHYDRTSIQESISRSDPLISYLQVVVDLLARQETRRSVSNNLKRVSRTIEEGLGDRQRVRYLVDVISRCVAANNNDESRKVLLTTLEKLGSDAEIVRSIEEAVIPEGRVELTQKVLRDLTDRKRQSAIPILCSLTCSRTDSLRELAIDRLVELAKNPTLLAAWAVHDPGRLLEKTAFEQLVERVGLDRLPNAFRDFFRSATSRQAEEFVSRIDGEASGAEEVILSAVECGSLAMRNAAVGILHRFSSPVMITTLVEIVKRNNYRDSPDLAEVRGALKSLLEISAPRSREFLDQVINQRTWLRHVYRKDIRGALLQMREKTRRRP